MDQKKRRGGLERYGPVWFKHAVKFPRCQINKMVQKRMTGKGEMGGMGKTEAQLAIQMTLLETSGCLQMIFLA